MATYQGALRTYPPAHAQRMSFTDVLASIVGYVLFVAFVGSIVVAAAFGLAFAVEEVSTWTI